MHAVTEYRGKSPDFVSWIKVCQQTIDLCDIDLSSCILFIIDINEEI